MEDGVLKGILWHQGESDCKPAEASKYQEGLTALIARFRKEFAAPDLPFIIGQLGQFEGRTWSDARKQVDAAHQAIAAADPSVAFVSSDGLSCNSDHVHFNAASQRTFGARYAEAFLRFPPDE